MPRLGLMFSPECGASTRCLRLYQAEMTLTRGAGVGRVAGAGSDEAFETEHEM
jgi:hypothetical protein